MDFIAIDFETANSSRASVCSIGLVEYADGKCTDEYYSLVRPKENFFDGYNSYIHGITAEDVENADEFNSIWNEVIKEKVDGKLLIAHNASFDMSVLRYVLDEYNLPYPTLTYNCTRNIGKKTWQGLLSYDLSTISEHLDIQFTHHHALEDAHAAAKIFVKALEYHSANNLNDILDKINITNGMISDSGYRPARFSKKRGQFDIKNLVAATSEFDETHPFYGSSFVFTGTLESLVRKDAMQKVVDRGGDCGNSVNQQTNYLVMGVQDFSKFKDGNKSSKLKKAEVLINKGVDLEVLTEDDFLALL